MREITLPFGWTLVRTDEFFDLCKSWYEEAGVDSARIGMLSQRVTELCDMYHELCEQYTRECGEHHNTLQRLKAAQSQSLSSIPGYQEADSMTPRGYSMVSVRGPLGFCTCQQCRCG